MSKTTYPQYRVSEWIDTSEASMNKPSADIWYGVQVRTVPRGQWMHAYANGAAILFKTVEEASAKCDELRAHLAQSGSPGAGKEGA